MPAEEKVCKTNFFKKNLLREKRGSLRFFSPFLFFERRFPRNTRERRDLR